MSGSEAVERLRVFLLETPFKRNVRREIPISVNDKATDFIKIRIAPCRWE